MAYIQVIGGLALLVIAGDILVRGAVSMASRLGMSTLAIGMTVVAFGTSAPELVVAIDAVLTGVPTLALGNVVGSNIANIWLVIGVPAILAPIMCRSEKLRMNIQIMLASSILLIIIGYFSNLNFMTGLLFLMILFLFILLSIRNKQVVVVSGSSTEEVTRKPENLLIASLLVLAGLGGLVAGAHILVTGSIELARAWGVSEAIIGLTIVAVGTSLPELVTATVAAIRNECDVAVGNVIGSNIFNIFAILGTASLFGNIPIPQAFLDFDLWVMLLAAFFLLPFAVLKRPIGRKSGIIFLLAYVTYIILLAQGVSAMSASSMEML